MKNTIIYIIAFLTTICFGIGTMAFMAHTPYKTRIITLKNDYRTVKLYGLNHFSTEEFYDNVFKDFKQQEKEGWGIMTEGYNTFGTPEGKIVELNLLSKVLTCSNLSNLDIKKYKFKTQNEYIKKNELNYNRYLKDINIFQMASLSTKKIEKENICFEIDSIEKYRVFHKLSFLTKKETLKHTLLYNRDINLTNEILLSPKKYVAAYYGNEHLDFTTELLQKVGFKIEKIEYINAF